MRRMATGDAIPASKPSRARATLVIAYASEWNHFEFTIRASPWAMMRNVNDVLSEVQHHSFTRAGAGMPSCFILR
jgi:hypothetical protein